MENLSTNRNDLHSESLPQLPGAATSSGVAQTQSPLWRRSCERPDHVVLAPRMAVKAEARVPRASVRGEGGRRRWGGPFPSAGAWDSGPSTDIFLKALRKMQHFFR